MSWYCGAAAASTSAPRCAARYAIVALRCMISAVAASPAATVSGDESAVGCASPALNCGREHDGCQNQNQKQKVCLGCTWHTQQARKSRNAASRALYGSAPHRVYALAFRSRLYHVSQRIGCSIGCAPC